MRASSRILALVAVFITTACGTSEPPGGNRETTTEGSDKSEGSPKTDGVAVLATEAMKQKSKIYFTSPGSGKIKLRASLPDETSQYIQRDAFSSDWKTVTWAHEGKIKLAKMDQSGTYRTTDTINPPEGSFSAGETSYSNPRISRDGKHVAWLSESESGSTKLLHTPVDKIGSPPKEKSFTPGDRKELTNSNSNLKGWRIKADGTPQKLSKKRYEEKEDSSYEADETEIAYTEKDGKLFDGQAAPSGSAGVYRMTDSLDHEKVLLNLEESIGLGVDSVTPAWWLSLDANGEPTLQKAVKAGETDVYDIALSPNGKTLLLETENGWYRQPADNADIEPERVFEGPDIPESSTRILDWT